MKNTGINNFFQLGESQVKYLFHVAKDYLKYELHRDLGKKNSQMLNFAFNLLPNRLAKLRS